jgi:hypothetical protein
MLKKIACVVLAVAMLAMIPVIAGCDEPERKEYRHTESKRVVGQHTVVE